MTSSGSRSNVAARDNIASYTLEHVRITTVKVVAMGKGYVCMYGHHL